MNDVEVPAYRESENIKKASKRYWKWLTEKKNISSDRLYKHIIENAGEQLVVPFKELIQSFIGQ